MNFATFVGTVSTGTCNDEATRQQDELVQYLEEHARDSLRTAKGKITVTLEFTIEPNGATKVEYDVDTKRPKPLRPADQFFAVDGILQRKNPKQEELPIRPVAAAVCPF